MQRPASDSLASIFDSVAAQAGQTHAHALSVAILRNHTVEGIVPLLKHYAHGANLTATVTLGGFDTIRQDILDPASAIRASEPDVVVLSVALEYLDPSSQNVDWDESAAREFMLGCAQDLLANSTALIVVPSLLAPLHVENGLGAGSRASHRVARVAAINDALRAIARENPRRLVVVDSDRLVQQIGEANAFDYRFGFMYRAPFGKELLAAYARAIVKAGRLTKGLMKKVLVLDCDNTLWGGVVGEDGLEGISLDPHEYPGRCYYEFQRSVVNLASQGVAVALCSKNEEADVWSVLDRHPHALLRRDHLSASRINWDSKPANISSLAAELNVGLDTIVFVDDSELECDQVRTMLPAVKVITAPAEAYDLPRLLYVDGLFDTLWISNEDRERTRMYQEAHVRETASRTFADLDSYLRSLDLKADVRRASPETLPRIAQLVGKTNQFNLTTRRYSDADIEKLAGDPDSAVFSLAASDRFGDLGLVGVLIARRRGAEAAVDSLLLSCRALGRRLELAFVDYALAALDAAWKADAWTAEFIATERNAQVEKFWDSVGFEAVERLAGSTTYRLSPPAVRTRPDLSFIVMTGDA